MLLPLFEKIKQESFWGLTLLTLVVMTSCTPKITLSHVANGWSKNSVNSVVFRKHSLYTHNGYQYTGFYDNNRDLILGKRKLGTSAWDLHRTQFKGNAFDAHNSISLIVDEAGYLHVSWDQHNSYLRYAKSIAPASLELSDEQPMTGKLEKVVTYPEFHPLTDGQILFTYRSGESGSGDLVLNIYDIKTQQWSQLHQNLIDGEGARNAYWQITTDPSGTIHISWVWRESADVASNHDMCYAKSLDGGRTWLNSRNEKYTLPINQQSAEVVSEIPQSSELINQTSMTTDSNGNPLIASYWKDSNDTAPQYKLIRYDGSTWQTYSLGFRQMDFSLSGVGTKAIPIARPQVLSATDGNIHVVFRDLERDSKVSVATANISNLNKWKVQDLTNTAYPAWEPTFDPVLWGQSEELHLFLQHTIQIDGEGIASTPPTAIKVLEWSHSK